MGSWTADLRRFDAEQRRQERENQKRQKDLVKLLKEQAKLSALEQARLEVEAYENVVEVLLSVHKEQAAPMEWARFALALPPHEPRNVGRYEFSAELKHGVAELENAPEKEMVSEAQARLADEKEHRAAHEIYTTKLAEWERMRALAKRVLAGESGAYSEVIAEFSPLSDVAGLGSSLQVVVHSPKLLECLLTVNGREIVPAETKSLTAAGKLSVKAMPKPRFHEIYQDYVCGCVLRVVREMLALLPVDTVLVTASVISGSESGGAARIVPVLSVALGRGTVAQLDFEQLDPSDSIEHFLHRGDVQASRKSGEFLPIEPLTLSDLASPKTDRMDISSLLDQVHLLRSEIASKLSIPTIADESQTVPSSLS